MAFPIEVVPYINYIGRRLFGDRSLRSAAYRQEVLCAEETVSLRQAIFLPGQVERVTGTIDELNDRYTNLRRDFGNLDLRTDSRLSYKRCGFG